MMHQAMAAKPAVFTSEPEARARRVSTPILLAALVGDTLVVFLALTLSSWLRFGTGLAHLGVGADFIPWTDYLNIATYGALLFLLLLPHHQLYDLHQIMNLRRTVPVIIKAGLTWFLTFMALSWLLRHGREISRLYVMIAFGLTTSLFVLWRLLLAAVLGCESIAQRFRQRILFVGWSEPAEAILRAIRADTRRLYEVIGFVPSELASAGHRPDPSVPGLGSHANLPRVLKEHDVDTVILADLNPATDAPAALANLCEKELVDFKVIPRNCFQIFLSRLHLQTVSGVPVFGVTHFSLDLPHNVLLKRAVDLTGGLIGLVLSAPIIALFGLLVYRESPGPIIYRQRRVGRYGRPFWIYKIRSMKMSAEGDGRVGWTVRDDPRRLRIGAFMRRWNIDELPQFWNVLLGHMSLIGPRPERPELIRVFKEEVPHYNARHHIKPGITGWAQVNGFRGDTDLGERIRCDLYYIENWSLLLDLQILLMTIFTRSQGC
jgi:exopolysaccharide biosynthesis polyprenyl glycosylphosphotransferase